MRVRLYETKLIYKINFNIPKTCLQIHYLLFESAVGSIQW